MKYHSQMFAFQFYVPLIYIALFKNVIENNNTIEIFSFLSYWIIYNQEVIMNK